MVGDNSQNGIFSGIKLYDKNKYRMLGQGGALPHFTFPEQNQRVKEPAHQVLKEEKVRPELQLFTY